MVARGDPTKSEQFRSVVAVDGGFVVTGSEGFAGERARALHSDDGTSWTREPFPARIGMDPGGLFQWGRRVLAVGAGETGQCAHPYAFDTWVRDVDGSWQEAPFDPLFCMGGNPSAVIFGGRPWLVGAGSGDIPILVDSRDGLTWTDHGDRVGDAFLETPGVDASGLWLFGRGFDGTPVVMRSVDGRTWATSPLRTSGGQDADAIAAVSLGDRLIVIASSGDRAVRLTPAGDGWDEAEVAGLPHEEIASVQSVGDVLVAIGSQDDATRDLWISRDGLSWRPLQIPREATAGSTLYGMAATRTSVVLVGQVEAPDGAGAGAVGAIWTAPASILIP
jgi:hypothetical protein